MIRKLLSLVLCLFLCVPTLTSCSAKYEFQYAFFPMEIADSKDDKRNFSSSEIEESYVALVKNYLDSITSFVNEKFELNISKPMPEVKSYTPTYEALASYSQGTIYLYTEGITDDEAYGIVHELIHYLSDNNGLVGFIHEAMYQGDSMTVGYGLTEGLTEVITIMYCEENNIPLPERIIDETDYYCNNRNLAEVYYMLEPQTIEWLFKGDHESMTNFVKTSLDKVSTIPSEYSPANVFDLHLYVYQDILMDTMTGAIEDDYSFKLMYTASFEMAAVTVRASTNEEIKKTIYDEVLIKHDSQNTIKNMIFN